MTIGVRVDFADDQPTRTHQVPAAALQPTGVAADADVAIQKQCSASATLARHGSPRTLR
jgi:hypothetical protein